MLWRDVRPREEDTADLVEAGEEVDPEAVSDAERQALEAEEVATIEELVDEVAALPTVPALIRADRDSERGRGL